MDCQQRRVETEELFAHSFALLQHRVPGQPGLHAFKHQTLKQLLSVALGDTPLMVVVLDVKRVVATPAASLGFDNDR